MTVQREAIAINFGKLGIQHTHNFNLFVTQQIVSAGGLIMHLLHIDTAIALAYIHVCQEQSHLCVYTCKYACTPQLFTIGHSLCLLC